MGEVIAPPEKQTEIAGQLADIFARRTRDEWAALLVEHDCCCEPVYELDEIADHPLHRARGVFFDIEDETLGTIQQLRTPVGTPRSRVRGPHLGEHSAEVLAEYGFGDDEIAALVG